jgi:hypothetical protein
LPQLPPQLAEQPPPQPAHWQLHCLRQALSLQELAQLLFEQAEPQLPSQPTPQLSWHSAPQPDVHFAPQAAAQTPPQTSLQPSPQVVAHFCPQPVPQAVPQSAAQLEPQSPWHCSPQVEAQAAPQLDEQVVPPQPLLQSATQALPQPRPHADVQPPTQRALFSASSITCRSSSSCLALSLTPIVTAPPSQGKVSLPS